MKPLPILLVLVLWGSAAPLSSSTAQESSSDGPEAVFEEYMAAMRTGDWAACSRIMHSEALAEFHQAYVSLAQSDKSGEVASVFFGVESPDSVAKVTPEACFERVMNVVMGLDPMMGDVISSSMATVLGTVPEGDVRHVVYRLRLTVQGTEVSKVSVFPFQRDGEEWRALLTGDMREMIQAMQAQVGQ